jgi:hypothetical protein
MGYILVSHNQVNRQVANAKKRSSSLTFNFLLDDNRERSKERLLKRRECSRCARNHEPKKMHMSTHHITPKEEKPSKKPAPHQSRYTLKDELIKVGITGILRDDA